MTRAAENYDTRSAARILAVQALYQMDIAKTSLEDTINEFIAHRLDRPMGERDEINLPPADAIHFESILRGVIAEQSLIDKHVSDILRDDWKLSRLDSTLRALLRAGTYEMLYCSDVPPKAVVSEYTDMAHAFFDGPEAGMANALLDKLATQKAQEKRS